MFTPLQKWFSLGIASILISSLTLHADKHPTNDKGPWFTGPLLTSSASMVAIDNFNLEPYIYLTRVKGVYDKDWKSQPLVKFWSTNYQLPIQVGLNSWSELSITPEVLHNHISAVTLTQLPAASSTQFGDLPVQIGFQIIRAKPGHWYPNIGFQITETFPTGRCNNLDPLKRKMDVGGLGTYSTTFTVLLGKLFHVTPKHALNTRASLGYVLSTPVNVRGFNSYGGGIDTKGRVHPGQSLQALIGMEYEMTLNWVAAIDFDYVHNNKSPFSGRAGFTAPGVPATVGYPSTEQFSLAPALEYNFSEKLGLIAGVWFTVAGRNNFDFTSGVAAFNWYY